MGDWVGVIASIMSAVVTYLRMKQEMNVKLAVMEVQLKAATEGHSRCEERVKFLEQKLGLL